MHQHEYDPRWERGWRKLEAMARRFGGASGFARGSWDGFGDTFRVGRMLASGDLRLIALYLIEQQPRHGYDIIKAVEDKSQGFYSPSPGIVYPALTFLEEAGFVTAAAEGNKKLYTITEEGRAHLADNREAIQSTLDFLEKAGARMKQWREKMSEGWTGDDEREEGHRHGRHRHRRADRDMPGVVPEVNDARRELKAALAEVAGFGEQAQRRVAEILQRAAEDVRAAGRGPEDAIDL